MSDMHKHDGKLCWFRCLQGQLFEMQPEDPNPRFIKKDSESQSLKQVNDLMHRWPQEILV